MGTAIGNIAATLNSHFKFYDSFSVIKPTSASLLLADTKTITGEYGREYVQNVATQRLPFWGGHFARHYDTVYGWYGSSVTVAEEWNPEKIGLHVNYRNPYGSHPHCPKDVVG